MADPNDIARTQSAYARAQWQQRQAERVQARDEMPRHTTYGGYDAQSGRHAYIRSGDDVVTFGSPINNTGLSVGDRVHLATGAGLTRIEGANYRPRRIVEPQTRAIGVGYCGILRVYRAQEQRISDSLDTYRWRVQLGGLSFPPITLRSEVRDDVPTGVTEFSLFFRPIAFAQERSIFVAYWRVYFDQIGEFSFVVDVDWSYESINPQTGAVTVTTKPDWVAEPFPLPTIDQTPLQTLQVTPTPGQIPLLAFPPYTHGLMDSFRSGGKLFQIEPTLADRPESIADVIATTPAQQQGQLDIKRNPVESAGQSFTPIQQNRIRSPLYSFPRGTFPFAPLAGYDQRIESTFENPVGFVNSRFLRR